MLSVSFETFDAGHSSLCETSFVGGCQGSAERPHASAILVRERLQRDKREKAAGDLVGLDFPLRQSGLDV